MKFKELGIKSVEGADGGGITAYASTFDREPDSYGDVIAEGAFADTLKAWEESGKPIPLLFGHQMDDPEMNIGRVVSAEEDERGLKVSAEFDPDNPKAQYVRKLVNEGRISKLSFAFDVLDEAPVELDGGIKANELRKLDLFEVSLVTVPANSHAEVIEAKRREKYGRAISKANGDELQKVADALDTIASAAKSASEALKPLLPADEGEEQPQQGDDANESAGEEERNTANSLPKSRELIDRINELIN